MYLFIYFMYFFLNGWHQLWPDPSTLFFCIAVFPNCAEHLHPDFSMQNKLLKVINRSYFHQNAPYISLYQQQTYRKNVLNPSSNPQTWIRTTASSRSPAGRQTHGPRGTSLLLDESGNCACQDAVTQTDALWVHVLLQWILNWSRWFYGICEWIKMYMD